MAWLEELDGCLKDYATPSRSKNGYQVTTGQYARPVRRWAEATGLNPALYGAHSRRRTKVDLIYKNMGNLRAVQILLGHSKIESTVRYLGVDIDNAISMAEAADL